MSNRLEDPSGPQRSARPPEGGTGVRLGSTLLVAAYAASVFTLVLWLTGGFRQQLFGLRVSASNLDRPLLLAVVLWIAAAARWPDRLPRVRPRTALFVALCLSAAFMARYAAPFAAAADMYGYVAQAADWRAGSLVHPVMPPEPVSFPVHAYVPLGYVWRYPPPAAVALYPPGTSLHMAVASLVSPAAVYVIAPLAALATITGTFRLGVTYFTESIAGWGAVLVAFAPQLLMQGLVPMSDTLAAAYWIWALACAGSTSIRVHVLAGTLASMAVVVRPNLAPLLASVLVCSTYSLGMRAAVAAGLAAVPALVWLAWHNSSLYGAPLATGYGPTTDLFAWAYATVNVQRYGAWLSETLSPMPIVGTIAYVLVALRYRLREHAGLMLFVVTTCLLYLWYLPWPNWTFSRFLLPALPLAMLMTVAVVRRAASARPVVTLAICVLILGWEMHFIQTSEIRDVRVALSRFRELGEFFSKVPTSDSVITRVHSGSLRYYASVPTVRWDQVSADELRDGIRRELAGGKRPLFIDDSDDREGFEQRFGPVGCWADTTAPLLTLHRHAEVRVLPARLGCQTVTGSP